MPNTVMAPGPHIPAVSLPTMRFVLLANPEAHCAGTEFAGGARSFTPQAE